MFGFTEEKMTLYRNLAQDYAVSEVTPSIINDSKFIAPTMKDEDGESSYDKIHVQQLLTDVETIITLTTIHMAYEYAYLQSVEGSKEEENLKRIHEKYENYLVEQFIKYGVTFTVENLNRIIGEIIMEIPFLYVSVICEDEFDEDIFLDEKLTAYEKYLENNFSESLFDILEEEEEEREE